MKNHLTVIGAGLSGLAAAYFWEGQSVVYEATDRPGGAALSLTRNGFTFDRGPHVSFTADDTVKDLFARSVEGKFHKKQVSCSNCDETIRFGHPALYHLDQLPEHEVLEILCSLVTTAWTKHPDASIENYAQWCRSAQGEYFLERFTRRYTRKFWCSEPEDLETSWIEKRLDRADPRRVFAGILGLRNHSGYYYQEFRYPESGGFASYTSFYKLAQNPIEIVFNHRVVAIDTRNRWLLFHNGRKEHYDSVLFTIPLPDVVKAIRDVPPRIVEAASRLRHTSLRFVNICYRLPAPLREHWVYFYDEKIPSTRLSIFSNISESNAPPGCSSLQFEIPYTKQKPLPSSNMSEIVVSSFAKMESAFQVNLVTEVFQDNLDYGYVIFDHKRSSALGEITEWLASREIWTAGRYGEWAYLWSDQSVLSGQRAATTIAALKTR